jgi:Na+-transporting methylmalonyl-CoA/oxaloacetate decarboxylase gamma subunit
MWNEATRVAIVGFSVVFITLWILAGSIKVMSFFCKMVDKKGGKKK